jgi:hypothetical protein
MVRTLSLKRAARDAGEGTDLVAGLRSLDRFRKFSWSAPSGHGLPLARRLFFQRNHCAPDRLDLAWREVFAKGVFSELTAGDLVKLHDRARRPTALSARILFACSRISASPRGAGD